MDHWSANNSSIVIRARLGRGVTCRPSQSHYDRDRGPQMSAVARGSGQSGALTWLCGLRACSSSLNPLIRALRTSAKTISARTTWPVIPGRSGRRSLCSTRSDRSSFPGRPPTKPGPSRPVASGRGPDPKLVPFLRQKSLIDSAAVHPFKLGRQLCRSSRETSSSSLRGPAPRKRSDLPACCGLQASLSIRPHLQMAALSSIVSVALSPTPFLRILSGISPRYSSLFVVLPSPRPETILVFVGRV